MFWTNFCWFELRLSVLITILYEVDIDLHNVTKHSQSWNIYKEQLVFKHQWTIEISVKKNSKDHKYLNTICFYSAKRDRERCSRVKNACPNELFGNECNDTYIVSCSFRILTLVSYLDQLHLNYTPLTTQYQSKSFFFDL